MRNKYIAFILPILALLYFHSAAQDISLGLPHMHYYSSQEYNGGIQNYAINQNRNGLLYVANNFGLLEFDGTHWHNYATATGTKVRNLAIGEKGLVYVATQGNFGYFRPDSLEGLSYVSLSDSLPKQYRNLDETWKVFHDGEETIFCTFSNLFIYRNNKLARIIDPKTTFENFYYINHQLYVNQIDQGLFVLTGGQLRALPGTEKLKGMTISGMIPLSGSGMHFWISTISHGLFSYDGMQLTPFEASIQPQLKNAMINCAIRLRNGHFAVGTQNDGLFILSSSGKLLLHLNKSHGLSSRAILCLFEDRLGNLWLGHNNGITTVELASPFTYINEQAGLPGTGYAALLNGQKLYMGTNNGIFVHDLKAPLNSDFQFIKHSEGQVYAIQNVRHHILVGHHKGAFEIKNGEAHVISDYTGVWAFQTLKEHPSLILVGTYKGFELYKDTPAGVKFLHRIKGFEESSRVFEQDEQGNIWMTHGYKGVYKLRLNKALDSVKEVHYYGEASGLSSRFLNNVFRIRNELVFTSEHNVFTYKAKEDTFIVNTFYQKFFHGDHVISMAEDPYQNIYFITTEEIGVLEKQADGSYVKETGTFNKLQNRLNDDLQHISVLNANYIMYAGKEGFILYDGSKPRTQSSSFQVVFRNATIGLTSDSSQTVHFPAYKKQDSALFPLTLRYSENSIKFAYSSNFLERSTYTQYQYWLKGLENDWSAWTPKTEKEYTNLSEGHYEFWVRARNIYGDISKTSVLHFTVNPPWYRTSLAYGGYLLLVIMGLYLFFFAFNRKFKAEKKSMIRLQQKELNLKNTEIEYIRKESDEEIERLRTEKLKAEIESKNKELATSTMHLINKNSFISNVKNTLGTISKHSQSSEVKKELKRVITNIDKNISHDDDWEHFLAHFNRVHGDFTKRLKEKHPNLSPQEMKLCAFLRMNLSTKEIANLLNNSVRGVEIARYRLRKKLELDRSENLQDFMMEF